MDLVQLPIFLRFLLDKFRIICYTISILFIYADMSELADESDSKSDGKPCGFDPHYPHWIIVDTLLRCVYCALYVLFLKTHFWHTFYLRQSLFSPIIRRLQDVKSKDSKSATSFLLILELWTTMLIITPKVTYNTWIRPVTLLII